MTNPSSPADTVSVLMAERVRYESWLASLEARRSSTPAHIYERVHADYAVRLQKVVDQLRGHMTSIQDVAKRLTERLSTLDRDEASYRDERYEAELRASVGELSGESYQTIIRRTEDGIASLAAERMSASAELSRIREVLQLSGSKRGGLELPGRDSAPLAAAGHGASSAPRTSTFDELEFLKSVVDPRGNSAGLTSGTSGPAHDRTSSGSPSRSGFPSPAASPQGSGFPSESAQPPRRDSADVPAFLKDVPPEQVKTLKCQECSTMNYPTEWYCERCGAELAAL